MGPSEAQTDTPRCWIRLVKGLWRALCYFWATIFVGLLLGIFSGVFFLVKGTDLHALIVPDWLGQHLTMSLVAFLLLVTLTILLWFVVSRFAAPSAQSTAIPTPLSQRNRDALVHLFSREYSRQLAHSLQGASMIVPGLHERTDVTRSSGHLVFHWSETIGPQPLPPDTSITQAYDLVGYEMLILGEPGAGKTTLLVDLARELLARAAADAKYPIPVILNLSSWSLKKLPLEIWAIDQMHLAYSIPYRLSQACLEQEQWLFLLDGLDEVEDESRSRCIEAINIYRGTHFTPLVVCCRSREYLAQEARLSLPNAVELQPLDEQQVMEYLKRVGKPLASVRVAVRDNAALRQLITTPLMLSVVTLAYRDKTVKDLPQLGTAEEQQRQIFDRYVQRVLEQRVIRSRFTSQQMRKWLIWLASRMRQYSFSEFYLERLRPDWLETKRSQTYYILLIGLIGGLGSGLFIGLVGGVEAGLSFGPISGLRLGLICGLLCVPLIGSLMSISYGLFWYQRIFYAEVLTWSWKNFWRKVIGGLPGVLLGGLIYWLFEGPINALSMSLLYLLVFGLLGGISGARVAEHLHIKPNQGVYNSMQNALRMGLLFGLTGGVAGGLISRLLGGPHYGLNSGVFIGLCAGAFGWVYCGGAAYLQHYILRYLFWRSGAVPWHWVQFMEEATERILLQRIGGGYRFIHPLFLEYFAAQGTNVHPDPAHQSPSPHD